MSWPQWNCLETTRGNCALFYFVSQTFSMVPRTQYALMNACWMMDLQMNIIKIQGKKKLIFSNKTAQWHTLLSSVGNSKKNYIKPPLQGLAWFSYSS